MHKAVIKLWGVRGSLARPGKETMHYGGNPPCLEIRYGDDLIIIDAGTGIYELGLCLSKNKKPLKATILFSHYHWDHMIGLPFFVPLYNKQHFFTIIGRKNLKKALDNLLCAPNFPVNLSDFAARIKLKIIGPGKFRIGKIGIEAFNVNHPNGAFGYKFTFPNGKSLVHISDAGPGAGGRDILTDIYSADYLIHDAQFYPEEYLKRRYFGHSPYHYVLDIARHAKIKNIVLFHHDPLRTDKDIKKIETGARWLARKIGLKSNVRAAHEGMIIKL